MDKNEKKNSQPIDIDNMGLKNHLNTSFDIDKLVVSEDLINKTLKAIKESEEVNQPQEIPGRRPFPIRRFTGVAAAFLVLIVGFYAFQNMNTDSGRSDKAESTRSSESSAGQIFETTAASEEAGGAARNGDAEEKSDMSILSEDMASDDKSKDTSLVDQEGVKDEEMANPLEGYTSLFVPITDYFPVTGPAKSFTISDSEGSSAVLTEGESQEEKFYSIIEAYAYTEANMEAMEDWVYKIEVKSEANENYTYLFGDYLQVTTIYVDGNTSIRTFEITDMDTLKQEMDKFFKSLS